MSVASNIRKKYDDMLWGLSMQVGAYRQPSDYTRPRDELIAMLRTVSELAGSLSQQDGREIKRDLGKIERSAKQEVRDKHFMFFLRSILDSFRRF